MEWEYRTAIEIGGWVVNSDWIKQVPEELEVYLERHYQGGWQRVLIALTGNSDGESIIVLKRPKE
jgi:hypothetical protein